MLLPKRVKYRRVQRGRMTGKATRGNTVTNGDYGLQALQPAWITSQQIEAARIAMTRYIKRGGQVWIKIFPDKPVTEKPAETRMGSGKGSPEYWVAVVKPGRVLFEINGVSEETAREAMRLAMRKLPIKCKFVAREVEETGGVGQLLFGRFGKDGSDLFISFLLRLPGKEGVAVTGLRLAGKGFEQVLFGLGSLNRFHHGRLLFVW